MFRCKVCGWIHDGDTPPDVCVSCGATADRFRPMDQAEVDAITGALSSYGIANQGFDDIEVDYTRRIRLLSYVDASFYTNFVARSGPRLPIYTGDPQWFQDNIPCMSACPSHTDISRYIIMDEVTLITDLGIEIRYTTEVGRDITLKELAKTHDAVIISAGCQIPQELGVPGEDLEGVVSGLQFLEDVNLGQKDVWVGKRVVTVGGGFTSMDCVRSVLRMGAEQSIMTYRRSIQEIPVDALELEEAEHEGVEIMYMVAPTRVIDDGQGRVAGIELIRNELGAPDDKGRRRPEPVAGSEFVIPCDMVLVAIGQRQDNQLLADVEVQTDRRGILVLDENLKSELPNVWASGDYVVNPTNFISSIGEGKRVATFIDENLRDVDPN